jgi:putative membrane protein
MMSAALATVAYCGPPPSPQEIWTHWRLDPVVLMVLFAWLATYAAGARALRHTARRLTTREIAFFCAGWAIATLALVSPLCPVSVALFAARATQHVILTLIAAPLVMAGRPVEAVIAACLPEHSHRIGRRSAAAYPMRAAALFTVLVWLWHSPVAYAATFESTAMYWTMHLTLFGSACWLWATLLRPESALVGGLLASIASSVQMGLLGALITLSPRPFYAPHFLTTDVWGMTPLQDQQLGGVVMWVPGCTVFLIVATIALSKCLRARPAAANVRSEGIAP